MKLMAYNFEGTTIYKKEVYTTLCNNIVVLKQNGCRESVKKPSLYYHKGRKGEVYFADMRGTDMVDIWEDPCPLFYVKFPYNMPYWQRSRLASMEFRGLKICRLATDFDSEEYCVVAVDLGVYMSDSSLGWCDWCSKDFQGDGHFCCAECEQAYDDCHAERCRICNKKLEYNEGVWHHLNYKEDITILICRSCHLKVHRGKSLNGYTPVDVPQKPKYLSSM
jgi:hypothetical protein